MERYRNLELANIALRKRLEEAQRQLYTLTKVQERPAPRPVLWNGESTLARVAIKQGSVCELYASAAITDEGARILRQPVTDQLHEDLDQVILSKVKKKIKRSYGFNGKTRVHYMEGSLLVATVEE
jgi:hypothetical protein